MRSSANGSKFSEDVRQSQIYESHEKDQQKKPTFNVIKDSSIQHNEVFSKGYNFVD